MSLVDDVLAHATAKIGSPYVLGTEGPSTFDCSGLVWYCFNQESAGALIGGSRRRAAGYTRWFADQGQFTRDFRRAERGDLIVYEHPVGHIGLYMGGGDVISALVPPYGVKRTTYNRISVPFYGVLLVDYGDGRSTDEDAPDTVGDEDDTIHARDPDWTDEGIDNPRGRALWHIEFEDRPRRAMGTSDVVNKITRRRPPPVVITETDTVDGSPISLDRWAARNFQEAFGSHVSSTFVFDQPAGGPFPGSYIQDWLTQADPDWPCSGLGIFYWLGRHDNEGWYVIDLSGGIDPDWLGLTFRDPTGAADVTALGGGQNTQSSTGFEWLVGWGHPDPSALGEWTLLGSIDPFSPWEVFIPRSLLIAGDNALVIAPGWTAGGSFCGSELQSNTVGPLVGGEGRSNFYQLSSDGAVECVPVLVAGTGKTQWIPGDGDIDGTNATFELLGWNGTGVPEARIDGLILAAGDYTFDTGALTVTLRVAPDADARVAFRYNHS